MPDLIQGADALAYINYGWGFGPWFFAPLIWIVVLALVFWLFRGFGWRRGWGPRGSYYGGPTALELLDRRFAEGEITAEEYRERRNTLTAKA
jgi:putative membrane protein